MDSIDIVIIGAGTAGLSAAIYGVRAGNSVLVLEEMSYGGQIINTPEVENYPGIAKVSGFEFATSLYNQAKNLGAQIRFESVQSIVDEGEFKSVTTAKNNYVAKTVIIATGCKNRPLDIEGVQRWTGRGMSYCATCDGAFYRGKVTAVVGGGNTALEDAMYLSNVCEKVYVIHRRDSFRGEEYLAQKLQEAPNVEFVLNKVVTGLSGNQKIQQVTVKDTISGEETNLAIDGIFVAIGQIPSNERFENLVALDSHGYIIAGEDCATNVPGIFAAGDCRTKTVRQLTTAAADGAVAALAASQLTSR